MPFIILATIRAKPGKAEEVKTDLVRIVEQVKHNEPDTLFYQLSVDPNDDHLFQLWEEYKDEEALAYWSSFLEMYHTAQEPFLILESKSKDYTEVFDIRRMTPIASAK